MKLLWFYFHQLFPYTSWQLKARFHKWLHTWVKVRNVDVTKQHNTMHILSGIKLSKLPTDDPFYFADSSLLSKQDERGFTPLMWAAAFGEKAVVDFLLEKVRLSKPTAVQKDLQIYQNALSHWCFCFLGRRPQNDCEGAGECPDTGQLWRLCGHCRVSSQTWSRHWHLWLGTSWLSLHLTWHH